MAVVKNANAGRMVRGAMVLDLGDLHREAEALRADAAREAERIVEQSGAEAARLRAEAETKGYEQGEQRGLEEGRERGVAEGRQAAWAQATGQMQDLAAGWSEALSRWEAERAAMLSAARDDVIALALAMGRRIVHRAIRHEPAAIVDQLAAALALVSRPSAANVMIHPEDRPAVETALPGLLAAMTRCTHVTLMDDASMARGGCTVVTAGGTIDASIHRQIDRIIEGLLPGAADSSLARVESAPS